MSIHNIGFYEEISKNYHLIIIKYHQIRTVFLLLQKVLKMDTKANLETMVESLNSSLLELETWKNDISKNVDQFFLCIMGFIIYRKYKNRSRSPEGHHLYKFFKARVFDATCQVSRS